MFKKSLFLLDRQVCVRSKLFIRNLSNMAAERKGETSTSNRPIFEPSPRIEGIDANLWVEYTGLARQYKAVNLGQGFPDYPPPEYVTKALADVANGDTILNQYSRGYGHPRLVKAISDIYSKIHERPIDENKEVVVTCGAYQSLFCAIVGLVHPGEEVLFVEPAYDCYFPMVKFAGGIAKQIQLKCSAEPKNGVLSSADWKIDFEEMEKRISKKTKMLVINNPNNPVGKVFTREELETIAALCRKHNLICLSDEVYEWLVYGKERQTIRIATLPGMWERTITVGSAGKTFSVTGWKLGWSIGPDYLIKHMQTVLQNSTYTFPTPIQEAVARSFELEKSRFGTPESYFNSISEELLPKRDKLAAALKEVGMIPVIPDGGYFMLAKYKGLHGLPDLSNVSPDRRDAFVVKWLIKEKGLALIPMTPFYAENASKDQGEEYIRFCFFKQDETLDKAVDILRKL